MTPSELLKKNLEHYKMVLIIILIFLGIGYLVIKSFDLRTFAKYEIIIVNDLNTKLLIDRSYSEIGSYNNDAYIKYLKNFITSKFINSNYNKIGKLTIDSKQNYFISAVYINSKSIILFEEGLETFLRDMEIEINEQITESFTRNKGFAAVVKTNTQLYFNTDKTSKTNSPNLILVISVLVGIIIANFILILEYPIQKRELS